MASFTIPEDILGIPLFVPTIYNFFEIESPSLPNGDGCLVVRGDLNNGYKAFIPAPTLSPHDIFNTSDVISGRQWSMSCWLKLENLPSDANNSVMLGCSTQYATNLFVDNENKAVPFLLGVSATDGFRVFRDVLNNVASPVQFKVNNFGGSWQTFQNYWFLFVIDQVTAMGASCTMAVYMDTYPNAISSDGECGATAAAGVYTSPRYFHIGAYNTASVGRPGLWRIAKLAFHDHVLSHAERIAMWQAMWGTEHSYLDDFNRATLGNNWMQASGAGVLPFVIDSNEIAAINQNTRLMTWVRCLGSPNMYSQIDVTNNLGYWAYATVRNGAYQTPITNGCYMGGWSTISARWEINNGNTNLATVSSPTPTPPYTIRLESQTNGSGNVDLRLYHNGTLRLSVTDSAVGKRLLDCNAGVYLRGNTGTEARADNFRCGTL